VTKPVAKDSGGQIVGKNVCVKGVTQPLVNVINVHLVELDPIANNDARPIGGAKTVNKFVLFQPMKVPHVNGPIWLRNGQTMHATTLTAALVGGAMMVSAIVHRVKLG